MRKGGSKKYYWQYIQSLGIVQECTVSRTRLQAEGFALVSRRLYACKQKPVKSLLVTYPTMIYQLTQSTESAIGHKQRQILFILGHLLYYYLFYWP